MNSVFKPLLAVGALMSAFYLSISYRYGDPGWQVEFRARQAQARPLTTATPDGYDLRTLQILNRAVIHIKENYVDPSRINERKMLGAAMEEVQRAVAELLVEVERDAEGVPTRLTVRVDRAERSFALDDVGNLWQMSFKFKDIFSFVQDNIRHQDDPRDIEYAAINGMLSTLDPHSVLLRPDDYREMKLSTRGKFGGLGIVISIREGQLTIVNPIEDTPASRKGLKAGDKIVQIGLDSTVNMALSDAVDMLRGDANTSVDIWVLREGWKKSRKFTLTRANIKVKSVASRLLKGNIGLARVRNFQNTTFDELRSATRKMTAKAKGRRLKGLIIDLRGNPGGLLDQAIKVSDYFIESGPLVTTVGYGDKMREPKMATRAGTEGRFPVIVLVDANSASASEIVAGALKNHHRALLIGQQTFGKGSVQVIYDNKDDSALKLTIAQYLTPGDISIQSVGVAPDILTQPVVLSETEIDFFRTLEDRSGEKDLPEHLEHSSTKVARSWKPSVEVRYLEDMALRKRIGEHPNDLIEDFEIHLARTLLGEITATNREEMLEQAEKALALISATETGRIVKALGERDVDWNLIAAEGTPKAEITLTADKPGNEVTAGDTLNLTAVVRNVGDGPFVQLRAMTRSDNPWFDGRELLFGNIPPGESRSFKVPIKLERSALTRRDAVKLEFKSAGDTAPEPVSLKVEVHQLARPRFALSWQLDDSKRGNGDGLLQVGEEVELVVQTRNIGQGKSFALLGELRNPSKAQERSLFVQRGRVKADGLEPGASRELRFSFKIKDGLRDDGHVEIRIQDAEIREYTIEKVPIRVVERGQKVEPFTARLTPKKGAQIVLRGTYHIDAAPVVTATGYVIADGRVGDWFRVATGDAGYGWVPAREVNLKTDSVGETVVTPAAPQAPPLINLTGRSLDVETTEDTLTLSGEVLSGQVIKDILIYVNNKKVFFKSNAEPEVSGARLLFSARVPLKQGANRITLIARERDEGTSRRTVFVNRSQ